MVELRATSPRVVAVLASSGACERVAPPDGVRVVRVSPREVLLVGDADIDVPAIGAQIAEAHAIVDDVSDAWAGLVLAGDRSREALARVCELELPHDGWIQGEVARAAATVIVEPSAVTILVASMLGAHVEERIRTDAAELLAP